MALNTNNSGFSLDVGERLKKDTYTHTDTHTYKYEERKTKRLNLLAKPSVHQKLTDYAAAHGDTFNNLVHTLMEEFIEKNGL